MAAADAPAAGQVRGPTRLDLPPESVHAMWIEKEHAKSVVRLRIHQAPPKRPGRGTGFIAVNTTNRLVVMTCGHLFQDMEPDNKEVHVTFYDGKEATADLVYADIQREVALLLIDRSRTSLSPDETSHYTAVNFASEQNDDVRKGDSLVMLGYPSSLPSVKIGCFFGSVSSEAGLVAKSRPGARPVRMFGGDYGSGSGASGAPVFGSDGRVVGICISGHQDMSFTLTVPWIRDTLMINEEVKNSKLANPTIKEMIEFCYVHTPPPRGHAGAGSSSAGGSDAPEASGSGTGQGPSA